jgi:hypothetical protein
MKMKNEMAMRRALKVKNLRDADPVKYTWSKLDAVVYHAKDSHGGRSFAAYKRVTHKNKKVLVLPEPNDPQTAMKECYRFVVGRFAKLPAGTRRNVWLRALAGTLLGERSGDANVTPDISFLRDKTATAAIANA